jgi:hypothetical protein
VTTATVTETPGGQAQADPADAQQVRDLIRFGWAIAEFRGLVRVGNDDPAAAKTLLRKRKYHALPLSWERSAPEQRYELEDVVTKLAADLGLSLSGKDMVDWEHNKPRDATITAAGRVLDLAQQVPADPTDPGWSARWNAFAEALYQWDKQVQDTLAPGPFGKSSAYQLGRGLAEVTWALDPHAPADDVDGWLFLLGRERTLALTQLLERLDKYFEPLTAKSIMASLKRWGTLVENEVARTAEAAVYLRQQALLWRDLLVTDRDPKTLVSPAKPIAEVASIWPVLKALWLQILLGVIGIGVLTGAAFALAHSSGSDNSTFGAAAAVLGVFGITGSGLSARAKSSANSLLKSVNEGLQADLVVDAVTRLPPKVPGEQRQAKLSTPGATLDQVTLQMVDVRAILTPAPAPAPAPAPTAQTAGSEPPAAEPASS